RYFPDPDLVSVEIDSEWLERVRATLPELPAAKKKRFIESYGLPEYDAEQLTATRAMATYYETAVQAHPSNPKAISNWIMTELMREFNERNLTADKSPIPAEYMAEIVKMVDSSEISGKIGKDVFAEMMAAV
ncbi:TPA: Asp-tRNA(Asn)/Glu-tRNA(Gln) amidotransferase GatCAB subunit B, partial [Candidatus Sumerlaeota bacterium]|nr:Asp-tRNA(Asn)/Glu-tRNA(Gln) amidotransferase GatCAB subunit B [Candidatus Sumerlaeota bacterium]